MMNQESASMNNNKYISQNCVLHTLFAFCWLFSCSTSKVDGCPACNWSLEHSHLRPATYKHEHTRLVSERHLGGEDEHLDESSYDRLAPGKEVGHRNVRVQHREHSLSAVLVISMHVWCPCTLRTFSRGQLVVSIIARPICRVTPYVTRKHCATSTSIS